MRPLICHFRLQVALSTLAVLTGDNAEAVVLDLVQPQLPGWRGRGIGGEAWRNETRR